MTDPTSKLKRLIIDIAELGVFIDDLDSANATLHEVYRTIPTPDPNPPRERRKKFRQSA